MANVTNHYDLIVVGSDLAGLAAAALVARRGKRVLVVPHGSHDGLYRIGTRTLPLDPAPVIHMGTPPTRRVFQELGLLQQVRREHAIVSGWMHLVLDRQRLDLEPGGQNFEHEATREWPGDPVSEAWTLRQRWSTATEEVFEEMLSNDTVLVADGFWSRRFLGRVAEQLPARTLDELEPLAPAHPARLVARVAEPWLQHLSPSLLGKAASLRLAGLWWAGPEDVVGGSARVREILTQRIELHSGEVKRELRVGEILVRRGKAVGVTLLGKSERYGCDHVLLATEPHRLLDGTIALDQLPRPLANSVAAIRAVAHRYVLHAEVEEQGLSPALDGMAVRVPSPSEDHDWIDRHGIGMSYLRVRGGSADHLRALSITRIVAPDEDLSTMRERVLDELDRSGVLPFVHRHITFLHSPHDGREASDGAGRPLSEVGSAIHPMAPLYAVDGEPSIGIGLLPHTSGIKNLHFASRLTLPGLGMEGEFAAAIMAAGLVASAARTPFSRSPLLKRA